MTHWMMSWTDIAQIIGMGLLAFYQWMMSRSLANRKEITNLAGAVQKLTTRVEMLEKDLKHVPGQADLAKIYERINSVSSVSQRMEGEMSGLSRQLNDLNGNMRLIIARLTNSGDS